MILGFGRNCSHFLWGVRNGNGIAADHPFIDGNKRTAFVAADNLIRDKGYQINATDEEVVSFMLEVAKYKHTKESVEVWLKEKTGL